MTEHFFNLVLLLGSFAVLLPMTVFCAECLLSVILLRFSSVGEKRQHVGTHKRNKSRDEPGERPALRTVVLIPAHNEEAALGATLDALLPTLEPGDRVLVVADNCTDQTADIARQRDVEMCERHDPQRRGKPYALQYGLQHLKSDSPDVIVFLDADCRVEADTVRHIASAAHRQRRPAQALNLAYADPTGRPATTVSELGFRFKNLVRPLGCSRLGLPCHLMGTGMAVPHSLLQDVAFDGAHLAEDMQLGIEMALRGHSPLFCPGAVVTSPLACDRKAFLAQRTRWEQGHLQTALKNIPRLLAGGLLHLRPALLFLAFDLTVPPLALLVLLWGVAVVTSMAAVLTGLSPLPAMLLAAGGAALTAVVLLGWAVFCRGRIPLMSLAAVPGYMVRKIPIYLRFLLGKRQKHWLRTDRNPAGSPLFTQPDRQPTTNPGKRQQ